MDIRIGAWRKKPPTELLPIMEGAVDLRLYLIKEVGPTVFIFKDEDNNTIKVSIGLQLSCSLCCQEEDHCVHTQYVLQRIFRLEIEHPLLWQSSYRDNDIADLCRQRDKPQTKRNNKHNYLKRRSQTTSKTTKSAGENNKIRKVFDESDSCPICQEPLDNTKGVTFCKMKCGSNFHINCLFVWTDYRYQISEKISCPMCRAEWGVQIYEKIKEEKEAFDTRFIVHKGHKCATCKTVIKGRLFHCIFCQNTEICEKCYLGYEHYSHDRFLVKESVNETWKIAKIREKMFLKKNLGAFGGLRRLSVAEEADGVDQRIAVLNLQSAEILLNDQENGNNICVDRAADWDKFILNCFQNFGSTANKTNDTLGLALRMIGREISKKCVVCHKEDSDARKLKRLFCGHAIDEDCLLRAFKERGQLICPEEGLDQLKGWATAFKNQSKAFGKPLVQGDMLPKIQHNDTLTSLENQPVNNRTGKSQKQYQRQFFQKESSTKPTGMVTTNPERSLRFANKNPLVINVGRMFEIEGCRMNYTPVSKTIEVRQNEPKIDLNMSRISNKATGDRKVSSMLDFSRNQGGNSPNNLTNSDLQAPTLTTKKQLKTFGGKRVIVNAKLTSEDKPEKLRSARGENNQLKDFAILGTKNPQRSNNQSGSVMGDLKFQTTVNFQNSARFIESENSSFRNHQNMSSHR